MAILMAMKKRFSLLLVPLLCVFSCQSSSSVDSSLPSIDKNGNIYGESDTSKGYTDILYERDADQILQEVDEGGEVLLLLASAACSHCVEFEPIMVEWAEKTGAEVSLFYIGEDDDRTAFNANCVTIYNRYKNEEFIESTPTLYLLDSSSIMLLDFYENDANIAKFTSYMGSVVNVAGVRRFRSESPLASFLAASDCLVYLLDLSDSASVSYYWSTIYPLAKKSLKSLALIEYGSMSEEDQAMTLALLSLPSSAPYLAQYGSGVLLLGYDVTKNVSEAASLLTDYYA
jgi:hypothetical protein